MDKKATEKAAIRVLRSEEIFGGDRTVIINHAGHHYRLMITKQDKLILNK